VYIPCRVDACRAAEPPHPPSPQYSERMNSRAWAATWAALRLVAAAAVVAAVIGQLIRTVGATLRAGDDLATVITNFFSFFTILSNVGACVTLVIGAVLFFTQGRRETVEPRWYAVLLVSVTTYMLVTGIVYNTLLRNIPLPQGATVPWSNELLHVWVPLFLLADLLFAPRRRRLDYTAVWAVVAFPIAWVVYTLVRAPLVINPTTDEPGWWPYPFLNWTTVAGGGWGVLGYVIVIALVIIAIGFFAVWVGRTRTTTADAAAAAHS
jgi:uncharacterized membrane protein